MSTPADAEAIRTRLQTWLSQKVAGWRDVTVSPPDLHEGSGWSAEIFFADVAYRDDTGAHQRTLAIRRQAGAFELVLGGDLSLQSKVMAALDKVGDVPGPPWIGMEEDPAVLGAPFLVMGKVEGRAAAQKPNYNVEGWLADLQPAQRSATWTNALSALAKLHRLDWRQGFEFLDRPERGCPGLDQYLHYMQEWFAWAAKGRPQPTADAALDYVLRNRPSEARVAVLWGDPTPSNTMFREDGSVAALIDWELAALGPPEIDLAWWLYFDELFSTAFGVKRLEGLPDRQQTIALYEGFAGREARDMDYYDILTGLRMAIVAVRQVDRQISLGALRPDNKSVTDNLMTQYLARKLGMDVPALGPDFYALMRATTPMEEPH